MQTNANTQRDLETLTALNRRASALQVIAG